MTLSLLSPRLRHSFVSISLLPFFITVGCTSTKPYTKLAEAGSAYTGSLTGMIDKASAARVESSSYTLLQDRESLLKQSAQERNRSAELAQMLFSADRSVARYRESGVNVKKTALALQSYFTALNAFSNSTAPADTGTQLKAVLDQLYGAISTTDPSFLPPPDPSPVVSIVAGKISEGILRDELIHRTETILVCMSIFDKFIANFERDVVADMKNIRNRKYATNVVNEFKSEKALDNSAVKRFIDGRSEYLQSELSADEIRSAKKASGEFRKVFEKMTGPNASQVSIDDLQRVINDLKTVTSFIQSR